jgi:hypothetical protein
MKSFCFSQNVCHNVRLANNFVWGIDKQNCLGTRLYQPNIQQTCYLVGYFGCLTNV